jgi:hypothetical protein
MYPLEESKQLKEVYLSFQTLKDGVKNLRSASDQACAKALLLHNLKNVDPFNKQTYINDLQKLSTDIGLVNHDVGMLETSFNNVSRGIVLPKIQVQDPEEKFDEIFEPILSPKMENAEDYSPHSGISGTRRGKYKIATKEERKTAVEIAKEKGIHQAFNETKIPKKNISRWLKTGLERRKGGGRKTQDPDMEKKLYQWILEEEKEKGRRLSRAQIKHKARELTNVDGFKGSKGWLDKFQKRYNIKFQPVFEPKILIQPKIGICHSVLIDL